MVQDDLQDYTPTDESKKGCQEIYENLSQNNEICSQHDSSASSSNSICENKSQLPVSTLPKQPTSEKYLASSSKKAVTDNKTKSPVSPSSKQPLSHFKLPSGIDPDVFSSLPANIRGEIMAHVVMGSSTTVTQVNDSHTNIPKMAVSDKSKKTNRNNTLFTYFKKK